jgi:hypothetical protein
MTKNLNRNLNLNLNPNPPLNPGRAAQSPQAENASRPTEARPGLSTTPTGLHNSAQGCDASQSGVATLGKSTAPVTNPEGVASSKPGRNIWTTDMLPDSDLTVLMRTSDIAYPIWPGYHDGEEWISCDGSSVDGPVLGWMHLEVAAKILDAHFEPRTSNFRS